VSAERSSFRDRRKDWALRLLPSRALFIAGLLAMPAFLFNPLVPLRILQFFFFWFCAWLVGKRVSALMTLFASAGIIGFNLLVPYGLEIANLWGFRITAGALGAGIERAVTVEGLILLSRATVRSDLRFPGAFGALVGESFRHFDRIMERKGGIERKDPIGGIDKLMAELWKERAVSDSVGRRAEPKRPLGGLVALALFVAASWLPWLLALAARASARLG